MTHDFILQPQPYRTDEKLFAILCHLSGFLGVPLILPLIVYLVKKDEPGPVAGHAREVLNFHLSLILYALVSTALVLVGIGILLLWLIGLAALVFSIVAAIKASESKFYRYPVCIRFIS